MSSRPKRVTVSATRAATSDSFATSQRRKAMPSAWPCALATAIVSAPLASLRSATITLAPSARKRITVARPMPLAPAGTIATLPANLLIRFRPPNAWWSCAPWPASLAFRQEQQEAAGEIRPVLRDFHPGSLDAGERAYRLQQLPRAGEARRRAGLRSRVGRRAPLPGRIFPLFRTRTVPDGLRRADQAHPGRPRHRRLRAGVQPSDQDRREDGDARHPVGWPPACRHRPLGDLDRARWLPRQSRQHQEELGRARALPAHDVDAGDLFRSARDVVGPRPHHPPSPRPPS